MLSWPGCHFYCYFFGFTAELPTLRQMMEVPNEPGLCPNTGLEKHFLSDQSKASKMPTLCQLVLTKIPDKCKMCETPAMSKRQGDQSTGKVLQR